MSLRLMLLSEWQCLPMLLRLLSETPPQPAMLKLCKFVHFWATNLTPLSLILLQRASERTLSSQQFFATDLIPLSLMPSHFSMFSSFSRGQFLAIKPSPRLVTLFRPAIFSLCKRWQKRAMWPIASSVIGSQWSPDRSMLWIPMEYDVTARTVSSVTCCVALQNAKSISRQNTESLQRLFHLLQVYEAWILSCSDRNENTRSQILSGRSQCISENTQLSSLRSESLRILLDNNIVSCGINLRNKVKYP